jgi:NADH-quinone oxidoreductase subunit A
MDQYVPVLVTFVVAAVVAGVMRGASALLSPRRPTPIKGEPFECGNPPSGTALGHRFPVRFYLTAILFIVFDVEIVFMYPWAVLFRRLGVFAFVEMVVFVGILTLGLVYAWRKGAFEWD